MKKELFKGVCTALVTPFSGDEIDYTSLKTLLDKQIEAGVSAIVILGTTGEPCTLTEKERNKLIKSTINYCKGKIKVLVGCGSNSTKKAIEFYKKAEALGADGALIVTPYYNKCTQNGLIEHYKEIAKNGSLPIIIYNVPSRTGLNIDPKTLEKIVELDNIYGVKEASGNISQALEYFKTIGDKAAIYSGDDALNFVFMCLGGSGTISVLSNAMPKEVGRVIELCDESKYEEARALQTRLLPIINKLFIEVNPIPIKAALWYLGLVKNELRAPLTQMSSDKFIKLKEEIDMLWNIKDDSL